MRNTEASATSSPKEELPALLISQQQQQTKTPMTAKQFWFKNFTGQSIFEVMEAYTTHKLNGKDPQNSQTALQWLLDHFHAPEFEDARDEVTRSWESIAYCMEEFARYREQALVKTLDDRLQSAEAKRNEAQGQVKKLKEQLRFCEQSLEELQKRHTTLLHTNLSNAADGDL